MIILIRYGRLGHGLNSSERMPRLVLGPLAGVRVQMIACGGACTACIDEAGQLWTWGSQCRSLPRMAFDCN